MIVSATPTVVGKRVARNLGVVYGNTIRARHIGRDILAQLKGVIGGEIEEYTKLMAEARSRRSTGWSPRPRRGGRRPW